MFAAAEPAATEYERLRPALVGHCYRMLGSVTEAEDAAQESLIRAWKGQQGFDQRSSLKTWLYRIATNVCLDLLRSRQRRYRPIENGRASGGAPPLSALTKQPGAYWVEPMPDDLAVPKEAGPEEQLMLRQSIRLAFVAALQHLPPKQRAALLCVEVLGFSAEETAETLEMSLPAANSALQRARATLLQMQQADWANRPAELTERQQDLLQHYVAAFEAYDTERLVGLLREDAVLNMPPYTLWVQGPKEIHTWLNGLGAGCRGSKLLPVRACGSAALAQYRPAEAGGHAAWALITLEWQEEAVAVMTSFLDVATLFPRLGLPLNLPAAEL